MKIVEKLLILLMITIIILPADFLFAQNQQEFYLESSINDKLINIDVYAANANDLYAFEAAVTFENEKFNFKSSTSKLEGFSAQPVIEGNNIYYAFTKIGNASGENGKLLLFRLSFTALGEVRGEVCLDFVKAVDSKLDSTIYKIGKKISISNTDAKSKETPTLSNIPTNTPAIEPIPVTSGTKPKSDDSSEIPKGSETTKQGISTIPNDNIPLAKPSFNDIEGHWAYDYAIKLYSKGIIKGYDDGSIRPDEYITRAEAAVVLSKALDLKTDNDGTVYFSDSFRIPSWSLPHIKALRKRGVIAGYDDGSFRAQNNITRAELVSMVIKAFGQEPLIGSAKGFNDYESFPAWASGFIGKAMQLEIIKGYSDGSFKATNPISRGEVFAIVSKSLGIFKTN